MKILIACEFSGRVRDEFLKLGHNAISCDLEDTIKPGPHIKGDVLKILDHGWDMMIAFPPCTYLTNAGVAHFKKPGRKELTLKAAQFFMELINAPIEKIAVENPVGQMSRLYRKPDQTIHPWMFGDDYNKRTCLWLKNLPLLERNNTYTGPRRSFVDYVKTNKDKAKKRSIISKFIAREMARQWG